LSILSIDFETRSAVDLKKTGVYPYAADASTDVICMAWAFDDDEPEIWTPDDATGYAYGVSLPDEIVQHVLTGGEMRGWNANGFERHIWREIMVKRYGAPLVVDEQWFDTMAEARAMSLPGALDQAAKVTGVAAQKDDKGYRLMLQMSKPRKVEEDGTITWWTTPEKLQKLYDYCKQDVRTERAVYKVIRRLGAHERAVFLLDQRINDRGVQIDRSLIEAAQRIVDIGTERANVVLRELTNGEVSEISNHQRLTAWLQSEGHATTSVAKPMVAEMLQNWELSEDVRTVLETRAETGRTSTAKLVSFLDAAGSDDRVRGMLAYHAASTGRWGGRLVQPQNFPRGEVDGVEELIGLVLSIDYDTLDLIESPIVIVLSMLRSMMIPKPGHDLLAADFSAIEARVLNWLAGQDDVVENFRAFDRGDKTKNPYKIMAVRMGRGATVDDIVKPSEDYSAGKAAELGCGFGMGADKFVSAAWTTYQVRVTEQQAKDAVKIYRSSHPMVKRFWKDTENAVKAAIENPGVKQEFGALKNLKAVVAGAYLYIVLPSGRPLAYPAPRIIMAPPPWGGEDMPQIEYAAVNQKTRQWNRERTYGGKLVENIVQAVARDLLADAMLRAEERGYTPILDVHDEVITEVPEGFGSVKEFEALMSELPEWATGCPVAAEGWKGKRYRK
jgi:DNA polymerase